MVDYHRNTLERIAFDLYKDEEGIGPQFWGPIQLISVLWGAMPKIFKSPTYCLYLMLTLYAAMMEMLSRLGLFLCYIAVTDQAEKLWGHLT